MMKAQLPRRSLGLYFALLVFSCYIFASPNIISDYLSLPVAVAESTLDAQVSEEAGTSDIENEKRSAASPADAEWFWEEGGMDDSLSSVTETLRVIIISP
jgi:hypothetical protein